MPDIRVAAVETGSSRVLLAAEKLNTAFASGEQEPASENSGDSPIPAQIHLQWAPKGDALLVSAAGKLAWFHPESGSLQALVSDGKAVEDAKISPDGQWVSFVKDHNLWLFDLARHTMRPLTRGGSEELRKAEPDWAYRNELCLGTGYWWAPDSSAVAYLELDERAVARYPLSFQFNDPLQIRWQRYPMAGGNIPAARVLVSSVKGGEEQALDTGADKNVYLPRVEWLPDSKRIAVERLNRAQNQLELLVADLESRRIQMALSEKDAYWVNLSSAPHFFRDGRRFVWSSERSGYRHLYLYDVTGKLVRQLTSGDWEVTAINDVDEAGSQVYFTATKESSTERRLYRVGFDGSSLAPLTEKAGWHSIDFAPVGGAYIDTYSTNGTPPVQELVNAAGVVKCSSHASDFLDLSSYIKSPMEFLTVRSHDGAGLNAAMIKPAGFDTHRRYPVIVFVNGGPQQQVVKNAWQGWIALWHQMMAEKGFLIFMLDNRGTGGRGHLFEEPIHYRFGAQEMSDQRDGAAYLRSLPFVDGTRIGIWGMRYGGHLALHAVLGDPEDFKLGLAVSPVVDWFHYDAVFAERYLGFPQNRWEGYDQSSALETEGRRGRKLLVAAGAADEFAHFENTMLLQSDLLKKNELIEVMSFPNRVDERPAAPALMALLRRATAFFLENL
jgi:dipeptidyl-peptidase 4